ncbi:MAG: hypothetical protein V4506_12400 [Bacteroidota bacterium]
MSKENLALLKYDQLWLDYEILTLDLLLKQANEFKNGKDENTEHYRYATFKNYLQTQSFLSEQLITNLIDIIKIDSDISMASSMAINLLKTKTLTESEFNTVTDFLKRSFSNNMQKYIDRETVSRHNPQ